MCGKNKDGSFIDCGQCGCPASSALHEPIGMICGKCGSKVA